MSIMKNIKDKTKHHKPKEPILKYVKLIKA